MALLFGFERIDPTSNTYSDWLNRTNEMSDLFRGNTAEGGVVTANSSGANTTGNARINGELGGNVVFVTESLRGGDLSVGNGTGSANLFIISNTSFANTCDFVDIQNDLAVVGNVVIGAYTDNTDFFSQKLVVNGAILTTNTSEEGGNLYFGNTDNSITTIANGNMEIKTTSTLEIVTGTEERIRVDAVSGNVSIGGTQDSHHTVQVHANTDTPAIHITTDTTGKTATDGSLLAVSNTDSSLLISNREDSYIAIDTNDIERVRVSANGFVGINQTAPNEWLEVDGNIHLSGDDRTIFNRDAKYLAFGTDNTERTRISANGFIGINQTAPREWLEVDGNIHLSGDDRTIFNRDANYLAFGTSNTEHVRIADSGNVSIATTETNHQLTVNGDILFTDGSNAATVYLGNTDNSLVTTSTGNTTLSTADSIRLFTDTKERIRVTDIGDVSFYSANGSEQRLYWDANNLVLGVNTTSPQADISLDVAGNTHTTDLVVEFQTTSNTVVVNDELRGDTTLFITTDTEFTASASEVLIRNDLFVEGDAQVTSNLTVNTDSTFVGDIEVQSDSLLIGNVEAQSTIEFTGSNSTLEFVGANQTFIWDASNTQSTIRTNANGSLIIDADKTNDGANTSRLDLRVDNKNSIRIEDNHVAFYNEAGTLKRLYWDAANTALSINKASPAAGIKLDVSGNTQTTDLVVANETTSGNVIVKDQLRGDTTLTITTDTEFTSDVSQVLIRNDLFVNGDVQVSSNLTVNTDSTFVGDIDVQTDSLLRGAVEAQSTIQFTGDNSSLEFAGANQTFVWDSTESTIRTNADGSLVIDADKTNNGVSTSRMDLRVDDKNSVRIENDHVAFYNQAGTVKGLYWDATELVLGVNTNTPDTTVELDVDGTTQTTDLVVDNTVLANVITVEHSLKGQSNLAIVSNADFSNSVTVANNLTVDGTLSISTLDYVLIPDDYNNLIPNQTSGRLLGNTSNRWEGYFTDVDVSGNVNVTDSLTVQNLTVPGDGTISLPSDVGFTGITEFESITVTGEADFGSANVVVGGLTTNNAGLIGTSGTVTSSSPTKIDEFDKSTTRGFKYIIHGQNTNDASSAYAIEINCSHNGSTVFHTRFGEVSNNFDATIVPQINGANVELIATCPSASGTAQHLFNMVRIETR